jgi:hypothetical protein
MADTIGKSKNTNKISPVFRSLSAESTASHKRNTYNSDSESFSSIVTFRILIKRRLKESFGRERKKWRKKMKKKNKNSASAEKKVLLLIAVMLSAVTMVFGQWTIDEGFEGGVIPAGWTVYDANGDGFEWVAYENSSVAHSGDWVTAVECYDNDGDDWLITPQVTIQTGDSFIFFARAWYSSEDFNVKLSTTGNAIGNFDITLESIRI